MLIVHGDRDGFFSPEMACQLYRLLPDDELCVLLNTDHFPGSEQSGAFNLIVSEFLHRRGMPCPALKEVSAWSNCG